MAMADYCRCEVCGGKSFYDANMHFCKVKVDGSTEILPSGAGAYAGLCLRCAKTHTLTAVPRGEPVEVEFVEYL